jgi:hypothetical protein
MISVKLTAYVFAGFLVAGVALLLIARSGPNVNPLLMMVFVAIFAVPPLGGFWMMYQAIRYEKEPFPLVLLAFIPYTFLWYYFERVRGKDRDPAAAR